MVDTVSTNNPEETSLQNVVSSVSSLVGSGEDWVPSTEKGEQDFTDLIPSVQPPVAQYTYDASRRMAHLATLAELQGSGLSYEEVFIDKVKSIDNGSEDLVRRDAMRKRTGKMASALQNMIDTGIQDVDQLAASSDLLMRTLREDDEYAMEKEAFDTLVEFANENPNWADLRLHNLPLLEQMRNQAEKDAVIASILDQKMAIQEAQGGIGEFLDDTAEILSSILSLGATDLVEALRSQDWETSANILRQEGNAIRHLPLDQIPLAMEQFSEKLRAASGLLLTDEENSLSRLQTAFGTQEDVRNADSGNILTAVIFGTGAGTIGAALKATGNAARRASDAVRAMRGDLGESVTYQTTEDAVKDSLYFRVGAGEADQLPASIQRNLDVNQKALDDVLNSPNFERLTPDELAEAVKSQVSKLERVYNRAPIQQGEARYNLATGVYEMDILVGRANGSAFATKTSASSYLKKSGIDGEVVQSNGGWYIKNTQTIAEQFADDGLKNIKPINLAKRVLQAPRSFVDEVLGRMGTASAFNEARITGVVKDIYNRNIHSLPNKEFKEIVDVMNQGLKDELWYDPESLRATFRVRFQKDITEAQEQAYFAARQIEDFGHFIQNRAIYQQKVAKGLQTVKLSFTNVGDFNANVFTAADDIARVGHNSRIYDAGRNMFVRGTPEELDRLTKQGYMIIRPEDASWTVDAFGEGASLIATKASKSVKVSPLSYHQLNYLPGGRRKYTDKFFIGQTRSGQFSDGTRYQMSPRVFRSAGTQLEAEEWAAKYNAANETAVLYRNGRISLDEADQAVQNSVGKTLNEYTEMAEAEGWDITTKFKVRKDGEDYTPDWEGQEFVRMYHPEDIEAGFGTTRNSRLSARGSERLKNVREEDSETLDFLSAMNRSADQAIKMGAYNDFKISSINRFNTEFRQYMTDPTLTPYELATKGVIDERLRKTNPGLYNTIKGHQFYIRSVLRVRGEWDERLQEAIDQLAFKIEGKGKTGRALATRIHGMDGNPIEKLRGLNYDLNLGMFNPAQLLMQANSVLTALALSPRHGLAAMKEVPFMRYALIGNEEKFTAEMAKRSAAAGSVAEQEFLQSVQQFRRLGLNDFGTNLAMMDAQNTLGATSNRLVSKANRVRETGRFFFQEGERYGRLTAYTIARRKYADLFPNADKFGREADNWIRNETDRLLLSPNSDNNQLFTKGLTSLPTQFWSYMGKMTDVMLTKAGGRYTEAERLRLIGSQILFYGGGGIPVMEYFANKYSETTGQPLSAETQKLISNGLIDYTIFMASNGQVNTDFSATSGIGGFWTQMYENLWENPMSTVMFGATGSNITGGMKAMAETANMYNLWYNPTPEAVTATALAGVGSVIKSLSKTTKAYMAYNTGLWYDKYGRAIATASKGEAVASLLGLQPQDISDAYAILENNKGAREKYVNEVATTLQALHEKWYRAETDAEKKEVEDLINTFSSISQQTGYFPEVARRVQALKSSRTLLESQSNMLFNRYLGEQQGVDTNLIPLDQRRQLLEGID